MLHDILAPASPGLVLAGAGILIVASLHDLAFRTIPNALVAATALVGLALRVADGGLGRGLAAMALVFAGAMFCCLRGWMGGGDVKLLAAVALLLPPSTVISGLVAIGMAGGGLGVIYLVLRRAVPRPGPRPASLIARVLRAEAFRIRRGGPLPYGVGIAAGTILTLFGAAS